MPINARAIVDATLAAMEAALPKEPAETGDPVIDAVWSKFIDRVHDAMREARVGLRGEQGGKG